MVDELLIGEQTIHGSNERINLANALLVLSSETAPREPRAR